MNFTAVYFKIEYENNKYCEKILFFKSKSLLFLKKIFHHALVLKENGTL